MSDLGTTEITLKLEGLDRPVTWHNWNHPSTKATETTKGNAQNFLDEYNLARKNNLVPINGTVIDIGAFTGDSALAFGCLAGRGGLVLAFEPNPAAYQVLKKNCNANIDIAYIEYYELAIGNNRQKATFQYSDAEHCNGGDPAFMGSHAEHHPHKVEVACARLDRFVSKLDKIDLIKIDAEGSDAEIIHGISDIIRRFKPILKAEMFPTLTQLQRVRFHHLLRSLGYLVYDEESGKVMDHDQFFKVSAVFNFIARPQIT